MTRRALLLGGTALALAASRDALAQIGPLPTGSPASFSHDWLISEAGRLAAEPYQEPSEELPDGLGEIGYDQYRDIRFRPEARIWGDQPTRFRLDLFHRGFIFRQPVGIDLVEDGSVKPLPFSPALFEYGPGVTQPTQIEGLDFSGFRVRHPINTPDVWDEFLVFQGASYFRAVGRNQHYGLSARGLAINTAEPDGEEFPAFRRFWIERPAPGHSSIVIHALLDSPSATGAYRFEVSPGAETTMEVNGALFPRTEIKKIGIAPLTSMFMFDATNHGGFDDFRPAVHDSNGLQILTGAGEWLWRPLANPSELQISLFQDKRPRGFGLMQRARRYEDFHDLEAGYERRPSLWIEPLGDWGPGYIELVEIPTETEINDNIVAYWRPEGQVPPGGPWRFAYRMRWTDDVRPPAGMMIAKASRMGLSGDRKRRLFVIDFASAETVVPDDLRIEARASTGRIAVPTIHKGLPDGGVRVSFELEPDDDQPSELWVRLLAADKVASETWLYRWTVK